MKITLFKKELYFKQQKNKNYIEHHVSSSKVIQNDSHLQLMSGFIYGCLLGISKHESYLLNALMNKNLIKHLINQKCY